MNRRERSCTLCPDMSVSAAGLMRHIATTHREVPLVRINEAFKSKGIAMTIVECTVCAMRLRRNGVITHMRTHQSTGMVKRMKPRTPIVPLAVPAFVAPVAAAEEDLIPPAPWNYGGEEEEAVEEDAALVQPPNYCVLVAKFRRGAYYRHHTWRVPLQSIMLQLLGDCVHAEESIATRGIAAMQLLPGLVEFCRSQKRKGAMTPIDFLRSVDLAPEKAKEIVRVAVSWVSQLRELPREWPQANVEQLRARVESLTAENRFSSATTALGMMDNLLNGIPLAAPASAEYVKATIEALHPADDERDVLPDAEDDPPLEDCMQLSSDQVRNKFYSLQKKNTAAGNTGWTNEWLRLLGDDRNDAAYVHKVTPPTVIHEAFTNFFNKVLQGLILGEGRELLTTARLIMIPKPQGGLRPIRIECAIMRFVGAVAAGIARVTVGPLLRPMQLGGGLRSGVEFGARLLDAAIARGDCVVSIDIKNAFNTARHRPIWNGLATMFPGALRYYRMKHEKPTKMVDNQGNVVAWTRTGVGQGDPWGGLFFEIAMQPALIDLLVEVKKVEREISTIAQMVEHPAAVSAYEDDTQIRGTMEVICAVAPLIKDILGRHGFEVNVSKSKITGGDIAMIGDPPEDFVIDHDGFVALGVPVGSMEFRKNTTESMVKAMHPPAQALLLVRPRIQLLLLKSCFDARPSYLMRTAPDPSVTVMAARGFDDAMTTAVANLFQLEVTPELKTRLYRPRQLGGFGFTRHEGMATEKNQIISRTAYVAFLAKHYPRELQTTQTQYDLSVVRLGTLEGVTEATQLTELAMATLTEKNCSAVLSEGMQKANKKLHNDVYVDILRVGQYSKGAWYLSAAETSTSFMFSTTGIEHEGYFGAAEFRCAGRNKLGVGPVNAQPGQQTVCLCRKTYDPLLDPFHGMSCSLTRGLRTLRHNAIRDILHKLIRKTNPSALLPGRLELEPWVGRHAAEKEEPVGFGREVRADILWVDEAERVIIDIACVDPGCATYLDLADSYNQKDGAAVHMQITKAKHYAKVVNPRLAPNSVFAFVVEASGRLGPMAMKLVERICKSQTYLKSMFLREVSMICGRYMGFMLKATRDQYHGVH